MYILCGKCESVSVTRKYTQTLFRFSNNIVSCYYAGVSWTISEQTFLINLQSKILYVSSKCEGFDIIENKWVVAPVPFSLILVYNNTRKVWWYQRGNQKKEVIRSCTCWYHRGNQKLQSKKIRQYNGQKKKTYNRTNNGLQNTT